jgi:hypothetical protein
MAKTSDKPAGPPKADKTGEPPGFFAEENEFDRRSLLRIGAWGAIAVGAVVLAVISNQSSLGWHREQLAVGDLARQAQQIQQIAKEGQNETRRLASAVDTLNNDRDRLYSRVTVLEQGLDSVTGAIARQNTPPPAAAVAPAPAPMAATEPPATPPAATPAPAPQAKAQPAPPPKQQAAPPNQQASTSPSQSPPPAVTPVASALAPLPVEPEKPHTDVAAKPELAPTATSPAQFASSASALAATSAPPPLIPAKSMMGPPDPAAPKLIEVPKPAAQAGLPAVAAATPPKDQSMPDAPPNAPSGPPSEVTIQHTDFAVDLGSANSVGGLRALWRGLVKSNGELAELHPIIVVKESTTGLGMQLRLAAGPLHDAAAAAKICAALTENKRACETTVFDGQRLTMAADDAHAAEKPAAEVKPAPNTYRHGYYPKRAKRDDPPPAPQTSTLSSLLGVGKR